MFYIDATVLTKWKNNLKTSASKDKVTKVTGDIKHVFRLKQLRGHTNWSSISKPCVSMHCINTNKTVLFTSHNSEGQRSWKSTNVGNSFWMKKALKHCWQKEWVLQNNSFSISLLSFPPKPLSKLIISQGPTVIYAWLNCTNLTWFKRNRKKTKYKENNTENIHNRNSYVFCLTQ
jgi:hypothetical protein